MNDNLNIKKTLLILFFIFIWGIILVKTIIVSAYEPNSFFLPFYEVMLESTWQSHFNIDLLLHTLLFSFWVIYREKSILTGIIIGVFSILFGGVFSFLYLLICAIRSKGNFYLFFNGKNYKNKLDTKEKKSIFK
jgi:Na+-transporting methylmalonyl-CoA/oxaloacetate decarboxylase gamma subunit